MGGEGGVGGRVEGEEGRRRGMERRDGGRGRRDVEFFKKCHLSLFSHTTLTLREGGGECPVGLWEVL